MRPTHRYARIPVTNQWQKHRFGRMAFAHSSSLINVPWDIVQAGEYRILLTLAEQGNFRSAKDIHGWLVSNYACSHLQGESNGGSNTYINNHPKVAGQSLSWDYCPTFLVASTFRMCMNVCGVYICGKNATEYGKCRRLYLVHNHYYATFIYDEKRLTVCAVMAKHTDIWVTFFLSADQKSQKSFQENASWNRRQKVVYFSGLRVLIQYSLEQGRENWRN